MAGVHCDTPSWYTRSQLPRGYTVSVAGTLDIGPYGRNGATALRFTGGADDYIACPCDGEWAMVPSGATFIGERDVSITSYPASGQRKMLIACEQGGAVQDGLYLEDDGTLSVACSGSVTVLGTSSAVLSLNTHYRVGLKVLIHASAGTADVQVQGPGNLTPVNVLALTGQDTLATASATWDFYRCGSGSPGVSTCENWVFKDGSGGIHDALSTSPQNVVATSRPIADTAQADGVPSSGITQYTGIDDVTSDDDVTYNQLNSVGDSDIVEMAQVPDVTMPIAFVLLTIVARAGGAGTEEIAAVISEGGTPTTGAAHTLTASPRPYGELYQESPSVPWSPTVWAALDGLGYERTA
jgi:hypothetical protein